MLASDKEVQSDNYFFIDGPIHPDKAVGKNLPPVGDVSIKGIVNIAGFMEHAVLQSTRLHLPFEMSRIIARALQLAYNRQNHKNINNCNNNCRRQQYPESD